MSTYSYAQLEQMWINAGGPATVAPVAAAIALAESGGNPNAAYPGTTVADGQGSTTDATGLWQILGLPAGNFTAAELTDPASNAKMAVAKYQQAGDSFSPWQTYTEGTYRQYLQSGVSPTAAGVPAEGSTTTTTGNQLGTGGHPGTAYGAPSDTTPTGTPIDQNQPGGIIGFAEHLPVIGGLFTTMQPVLHAIATVIDYSFMMFEPGQGFRLVFAIAALVLAFFAYKILAATGAVPDPHLPKGAPV